MPPDVDVYAAAVAGRALATKCTGGYKQIPTMTRYNFGYISDTVRRDYNSLRSNSRFGVRNWDGGGYVLQLLGGSLIIQTIDIVFISAGRTVGGFDIDAIVVPKADLPNDLFSSGATLNLDVWNNETPPEYLATFLSFRVASAMDRNISGRAAVEIVPSNVVSVDPRPSVTLSALGGIGVSIPPPLNESTFDFYGRLEGGVGSILEVDEDGSQTEAQTALMTVRYDNRFRVGDWIAILEQPDFGYQIHSIENVGRLKWQTLTLKQEVAA